MIHNHRTEYLVYGLLFSVGLTTTLIALLWPHGRMVLLSVGASIIATAITSGLVRGFLGSPVEPILDQIRQVAEIHQSAQRTGLVTVYGTRSDITMAQWRTWLENVHEEVLILGYAVHFFSEDTHLTRLLEQKAQQGCIIQICLGNPHGLAVQNRQDEERYEGKIGERIYTALARWHHLLSYPSVAIRLHDSPLYVSMYKFDALMVLTPQLYGIRAAHASAWVVQRPGSMFDQYTAHFSRLWDDSERWSGADRDDTP